MNQALMTDDIQLLSSGVALIKSIIMLDGGNGYSEGKPWYTTLHTKLSGLDTDQALIAHHRGWHRRWAKPVEPVTGIVRDDLDLRADPDKDDEAP